MIPEIDYDCDLGGGWVEGFFYIDDVAAYLALQSGIPQATIRARIIEACGYCQRPPKSGEKVILMQDQLYTVDEQALAAMKRVIFNFVCKEEAGAIVKAYLAEPMGDVHRISSDLFDCEIHWMVITAVLDVLKERGRLPLHPSWNQERP